MKSSGGGFLVILFLAMAIGGGRGGGRGFGDVLALACGLCILAILVIVPAMVIYDRNDAVSSWKKGLSTAVAVMMTVGMLTAYGSFLPKVIGEDPAFVAGILVIPFCVFAPAMLVRKILSGSWVPSPN